MPDPLTITAAITLAGKCVNNVTKMVNSGRELEDAMGHISRWFECVSDVNAAERRAKEPSLFKKVTAAKSVEKEAFDALIAKRKMAEQRKTLYELSVYSWGKDAWNELVAMEKEIREERKKVVHARMEFRRKVSDCIFILVGLTVILGIIFGFLYVISLGGHNTQALALLI